MLKKTIIAILASAILISSVGCTVKAPDTTPTPAVTQAPTQTQSSQKDDDEEKVYVSEEWDELSNTTYYRLRSARDAVSNYKPVIARSIDELHASQYYISRAESFYRIYDEEFFSKNALVIVSAKNQYAPTLHEVDTVSLSKDKTTVAVVVRPIENKASAKQESRDVIFVTIPLSDVENASSVEVYYNEAYKLPDYTFGSLIDSPILNVKNSYNTDGAELITNIDELNNLNLDFEDKAESENVISNFNDEFWESNYIIAVHLFNPSGKAEYLGPMVCIYPDSENENKDIIRIHIDMSDDGSVDKDSCYSIVLIPIAKNLVHLNPTFYLFSNISFKDSSY